MPTMRDCSFCEYEYVGSDDAKMWRHVMSEHMDALVRAQKLSTAE